MLAERGDCRPTQHKDSLSHCCLGRFWNQTQSLHLQQFPDWLRRTFEGDGSGRSARLRWPWSKISAEGSLLMLAI